MSVKITGLDPLYRKLGNLAATKMLEPPMARAVYRLQAAMQVYPPAPAGSSYTRGGTYGRRWTVKINRGSNGLTGIVGTNVPYAPYVGSRMFQTAQHRATGWQTDAGAVQANEGAITADFQSAIDRALAS